MKNGILIILVLSSIVFSGCGNLDSNIEISKYNQNTTFECVDNCEKISGIWTVEELFVTPKSSLMNDEYAKENSVVIGMSLEIDKEKVTLDGKVFHYQGFERYNAYQIMSMFNLTSGQSSLLCGGSLNGEEIVSKNKYVNLISFFDNYSNTGIKLLVNCNDELLLWVGEDYEYIGFYQLKKSQKN